MLEMIKNYIISRPEAVIELIILLSGLPKFIQGLMALKEATLMGKVKEIIEIESQKVKDFDITNEEKVDRIIKAVYFVIPQKYHKFIPRNKVIELINMVYHTYVKGK